MERHFSFQPIKFRNKQEHKLKGINSQSLACLSNLHPTAANRSMMLLFRIWFLLVLVFIPVIWTMDSFCCSSNKFEYEYNFIHKLISLEQRCTELISISDTLKEQVSSLQTQLSGKFFVYVICVCSTRMFYYIQSYNDIIACVSFLRKGFRKRRSSCNNVWTCVVRWNSVGW